MIFTSRHLICLHFPLMNFNKLFQLNTFDCSDIKNNCCYFYRDITLKFQQLQQQRNNLNLCHVKWNFLESGHHHKIYFLPNFHCITADIFKLFHEYNIMLYLYRYQMIFNIHVVAVFYIIYYIHLKFYDRSLYCLGKMLMHALLAFIL